MIRFTKVKPKLRPAKPKGGKKAVLDRLKAFLSAAEPETVEFLLSNWQAQANAITYKELREAYLAGGITQKQFEKWQKDYSKLITFTLAPKFRQAANEAATEVKAQYPHFVYEPSVSAGLDFIKQHGAELVTNLAQEQRDALNALIYHVSGYTAVTPDEAARILRPCIGLTKPQALANARYRAAVKAAYIQQHPKGKPETAEKKAEEAAARYAGRQHRYRAQNIARTELAFAYNAGAYGATKDAQQQGYIGDCVKVWLTAYDERVCPVCAALDGEKRKMDEPFSTGKLLPPAHPSCRCAVAYEEISGTVGSAFPNDSALDFEIVGQYTRERNPAEIIGNDRLALLPKWKDSITELTSGTINDTIRVKNPSRLGDRMRGLAPAGRSMAMGYRKPASHILTEAEIISIKEDAVLINVPVEMLSFNTGQHTGFVDELEIINIRGDILPDTDSTIARDRMSQRAVLAHEYYGHYKNHPSEYDIADWRDEFRASYDAAVYTPALSDEDRALLMIDAYDRSREAGEMLEYDETARRIIYGY